MERKKKKKGFTMLELVIVIVVVAILVSLGLVQFTSVMEKGRKAEARSILGTLRQLEISRYEEMLTYSNLAGLGIAVPDGACAATHYFFYACAAGTGTCTATRCIGAVGKQPGVPAADVYTITLDVNGNFSGTGNWQ
ncbi:MAG: prepilin-type N-terminal cleavage/methylation domain-containing protein [Candidatus Omnitrophota bacterium]